MYSTRARARVNLFYYEIDVLKLRTSMFTTYYLIIFEFKNILKSWSQNYIYEYVFKNYVPNDKALTVSVSFISLKRTASVTFRLCKYASRVPDVIKYLNADFTVLPRRHHAQPSTLHPHNYFMIINKNLRHSRWLAELALLKKHLLDFSIFLYFNGFS